MVLGFSSSVEVYDLSGRLVWKSNSDAPTINNLTWNLVGLNGQKVAPGIYIYKVMVKINENDVVTKTNKMTIVE